MEEDFEDKLKEIYQNIGIIVEYVSLRKYRVKLTIKGNIEVKVEFIYVYDAHLTFDANINIIVSKIDRIILSYYKKGE